MYLLLVKNIFGMANLLVKYIKQFSLAAYAWIQSIADTCVISSTLIPEALVPPYINLYEGTAEGNLWWHAMWISLPCWVAVWELAKLVLYFVTYLNFRVCHTTKIALFDCLSCLAALCKILKNSLNNSLETCSLFSQRTAIVELHSKRNAVCITSERINPKVKWKNNI